MLNLVEHERSFITSGPGLSLPRNNVFKLTDHGGYAKKNKETNKKKTAHIRSSSREENRNTFTRLRGKKKGSHILKALPVHLYIQMSLF